MTGFSFLLPGLEQASDPKQLRGCLQKLTEQLQYTLSNLDSGNFSDDTLLRLANMENAAKRASDLAQKTDEDAKSEFQRVYDEIIRQATEISSKFTVSLTEKEDSILSQVTEDFTAKAETAKLEETFRSEMEQTSQKIEMRFSDAAEIIQEVDGELKEYQNLVDTYIQFSTDGITLGKRNSPFTAVLNEEKLSFLQNGAEVAYLSNNKLYITSAEILDRLSIGNSGVGYFDWVPRANGNLGMKWRN